MKSRYKKILLVVPPFYRFLGGRNNSSSLGLHYIAAMLNRKGHYTKVYNADADEKAAEPSLDIIFEKGPALKSILDADPLWLEIRKNIAKFSPDLLGITVSFSVTEKIALHIAKIAKQINSGIDVVVGGANVTVNPEIVRSPDIDFAVRGEGEFAMLKLAAGEELSTISNLIWGKEEIVYNSYAPILHLDRLPFPDWNNELYPASPPENFTSIMASRGCPFICAYCSSPKIWGRKVRFRSVRNVLDEIEFRKKKHDVQKLYFVDDCFNSNKKYVQDLCLGIIKENLDVSWRCEARINLVDSFLLNLMKKAGCERLKFGVESGSDRILEIMHKGFTVEDTKRGVKIVKESGIPFTAYIMLGFPTETREEMMMTYNLCREIEPDLVSLSIVSPNLGSELYEKYVGNRVIDDEVYFHQGSRAFFNENVDSDILKKFLDLNVGKQRT